MMANHCIYETCEKCGQERCAIGCNVRCRCQREYEDAQREQNLVAAAKKVLERYGRGS